jgi:hypothetical protein
MSDVAVPGPASGRNGWLERRFRIFERGSTPRTEVLGGVGTFLTMCYILFVNPAILSAAGVPFTGVAVATAIAAAIATAAMGLLANYPFALASGLGLNAVVAFDLIVGAETVVTASLPRPSPPTRRRRAARHAHHCARWSSITPNPAASSTPSGSTPANVPNGCT